MLGRYKQLLFPLHCKCKQTNPLPSALFEMSSLMMILLLDWWNRLQYCYVKWPQLLQLLWLLLTIYYKRERRELTGKLETGIGASDDFHLLGILDLVGFSQELISSWITRDDVTKAKQLNMGEKRAIDDC